MNTKLIKTLDQVNDFLEHVPDIEPGWESKDECYRWIELTLSHFRYRSLGFRYRSLGKAHKGLVRRYVRTVTGYSRAQVPRLLTAYLSKGTVRRSPCSSNGFKPRYTHADVRLLAETDRLHNDLSGPAIKKLCAILRNKEDAIKRTQ